MAFAIFFDFSNLEFSTTLTSNQSQLSHQIYTGYSIYQIMKYRPRLADKELERNLKAFGAVLIEGPKWCGKTTTAEHISKSAIYFQNEDEFSKYEGIMEYKPSLLLNGENPRLIDEWQMIPRIWDVIRFDIDRRSEKGLYVLTGSTTVDETEIKHSGAGRIKRMTMGTMSLFESGDSDGSVSLTDLFENKDIGSESDTTFEEMAYIITRGGWPDSIDSDPEVAYEQIDGYCKTILKSDIHTVDGIKKDSERMFQIMRSLSRNISTSITDTKIVADIEHFEGTKIHVNTVKNYVSALKKLHVLYELPAWSPKLRSKATIRTSPTRHFCDPAIAAYFLGASANNLMDDPETYGLIFESLVIRDLRTYVQGIGGQIYHYRDSNGMEADAVIHLKDGRWGLVEVKLGQSKVEEASSNLLKLRNTIDLEIMGGPSFLAVITCNGYAYRREDGVYVVPITCLKN